MNNIEKMLYMLCSDVELENSEYFKILKQNDEQNTLYQIRVGSLTNLVIENIFNNTIKIQINTFKKDSTKNRFFKQEIICDIEEISSFLIDLKTSFNKQSSSQLYKKTNELTVNKYQSLINGVLKSNKIKNIDSEKSHELIQDSNIYSYWIEKSLIDNKYHLMIKEGEITHIINFTNPDTGNLLDYLKVEANILVPIGEKYHILEHTLYYSPLELNHYPVLELLNENNIMNHSKTLESALEELIHETKDKDLIKKMSCLKLELEINTKDDKKIPKQKI